MGKIAGLVGALTTFGAVAYLLAPLPPHAPLSETIAAKPATASTPVRFVEATPKVVPPVHTAASPAPSAVAPSLVHQIQSELQRIGCYGGDVDGRWNIATQRAMLTLGERVSILRSVDTPDYIMLALARDQPSDACENAKRTPQRAIAMATQDRATQDMTTPEPVARAEKRVSGAGSVRVSMADGSQPQASSQPWHVTVQRAPTRRVANKASVGKASTEKAPAALGAPQTIVASTPSQRPERVERPFSDSSRMALGAFDPAPLRAGTNPRDPNAPAVLRGTQAAASPAPQPTPQVAETPPMREATVPPKRKASRPATDERYIPLARQSKRAWRKNVFTEMMLRGP